MTGKKILITVLVLFMSLFSVFHNLSEIKAEGEDTNPLLVVEGIDFEHDIDYKRKFDEPTVTVTGLDPAKYQIQRAFDLNFTRFSTLIDFEPDSESPTVEVDYGIIGTVNGLEVKLKLTLSDFIFCTSTYFPVSKVYIGYNPQTGYYVRGIYLLKAVYSITYVDGTPLDNPVITIGSLNGSREGVKPLDYKKISKTSDSIIMRTDILPSRYDPSITVGEDIRHDWYYSAYGADPSIPYSDNADYVYNPLTGIEDKYNPKVAISIFYNDSTNMGAYVSATSTATWQNAMVISHEPTNDLTVKKETTVTSDDTFNFKMKIWREFQTEEITVIEKEEEVLTATAYAVFDSTDDTLSFFRGEEGAYTNGQVIGTKTYYTDFENVPYNTNTGTPMSSIPWHSKRSQVRKIIFNDQIVPLKTDSWFADMTALTTVEKTENLRMEKVEAARAMFSNCTSLKELDTSSFYMISCKVCGSMFMNCYELEYLDLSGFIFYQSYTIPPYGPLTGFSNMLTNCHKLSADLIIPVLPRNHVEVFKGAATAEGARIGFKVFALSNSEIRELLDPVGPESNVVFDGYVDEIPPIDPKYLHCEEIEYKTEYHIFDLTSDDRLTYDLSTQEYAFSLKGGESLTIPNIPKSYNYRVYEVDAEGNEVKAGGDVNENWLLKASSNTAGTMAETITSTFSNHPKYDLSITKQTDLTTTEKFDFKLKIWKDADVEGELVTEDYDLSEQFGPADEDGFYTVTIVGGETVTVSQIPSGYEYKVYEVDSKGNPVPVGSNVNDNWRLASETNKEGHIADADITAAFTNKSFVTVDLPSIVKTISGDVPEEDSTFEFCLEAIDGAPMPSGVTGNKKLVTVTGAGTVNLGSIEYTSTGTFNYDVYETEGSEEGYTYDKTKYRLTVIVDYDGSKFVIKKSISNPAVDTDVAREAFDFDNEYEIIYTPVKANTSFSKKVEATTEKDAFTYTLKPVSNTAGLEVADMPMPAGTAEGKKQTTEQGAGNYSFGELEFSLPGTYVYQINEEKGDLKYTYDESVFTVTYTVTATGTELSCTAKIAKGNDEVTAAEFTNVRITGSVIVKYVTEEGTELDSVNLKTDVPVGTAYQSEKKTFEDYEFLKMDEESAPASGEVAEGTLTVIYVYTKSEVVTPVGSVIVKYVTDEGKELDSVNLLKDVAVGTKYESEKKTFDEYEFLKMDEKSAPVSGEVTEGTTTVIYVYTKTEVATPVGSVIVKYVTDEGKELDSVNLLKDVAVGTKYESEKKAFDKYEFLKMDEKSAPVSGEVVEGTLTVIYVYKAEKVIEELKPAIVDPPVSKVVIGTTEADEFTYTLRPVSNTVGIKVSEMPMPEGSVSGIKQITKKGGGEYEFGEFELSQPGTYVYEMTEEPGDLDYTYDTSRFTVTYVVTVNGNALEAERTITKNGEPVEMAIFTNIKNEKPVGSVVVLYITDEGEVLDSVDLLKDAAVGTRYESEEKTFEGYEFQKMDEDSAEASGEAVEGILTVIYVYTKVDNQIPDTGFNDHAAAWTSLFTMSAIMMSYSFIRLRKKED